MKATQDPESVDLLSSGAEPEQDIWAGEKKIREKTWKTCPFILRLCRIEFLLKSLASHKHMHSKTRSHVE
jgi:hypothetical protein